MITKDRKATKHVQPDKKAPSKKPRHRRAEIDEDEAAIQAARRGGVGAVSPWPGEADKAATAQSWC